MKFDQYIKNFPREDRQKIIAFLAAQLKVGRSAIIHWVNGRRRVSPQLVITLENLTNGAVARHELRPDIYPPPELKVSEED